MIIFRNIGLNYAIDLKFKNDLIRQLAAKELLWQNTTYPLKNGFLQ